MFVVVNSVLPRHRRGNALVAGLVFAAASFT
jgi:hypothetical protein